MLPKEFDIEIYKNILLRRKWYIIIPLFIFLVMGLIYYIITPRMYRASTLIFVQKQKVPTNYIRPTVSGSQDERIRTIKQQVTSRTNLENLIKKFNLYSSKNPSDKEMIMEEKVEFMRKSINILVHKATAFSISFIYSDPLKVMQVANELTSNFIDENLRDREEQYVGTTMFLTDELTRLEKALRKRETALTNFKRQHMGGLPDDLSSNFILLKQLRSDINNIEQSIDEARTQKIMIQSQLSNMETMTSSMSDIQQDSFEPEDYMADSPKLIELRDRLSALRNRYTDNHPDVVKIRKMIKKIEKEQKQQASSAGDQAGSEASNTDSNKDPFSGQVDALRFELDAIEQRIKSLELEKSELEKKIPLLTKRIEETPKLQLELISLQRDYDTIKSQYSSLLAKKLESELAENMEKRQKGEQFKILDQAIFPEKPFRPNLRKILMIAIMIGLAAGFGLALGLEYIDQSFRDVNELIESLQVPVLAIIPQLEIATDAIKRQRNKVITYCLAGSLIVAVGIGIWLWLNGDLQQLVHGIRGKLAFIR